MDELRVRGITIPDHELDWRFTTSGGPGGQHANRSSTAVELRFTPRDSQALPARLRERVTSRLSDRMTNAGELIVTASDHRSQTRNRETALGRMRALLLEATAPPARPRRPTRPSRAAKRRRLEDKARRAETKRLRRRPDA